MSTGTDTKTRVEKILDAAGEDVQRLIGEVLKLEKESIHMTRPRGIVQDIVDVIKRIEK